MSYILICIFYLKSDMVFPSKRIIGCDQLHLSYRLPKDGFSLTPLLRPRDWSVLVFLCEARIIQMT